MPFKIRSSKYRHVYGNPHKEDVCYKNIKITKNAAHDSAFCAVNPKFVAIVTEECGGGAFIVVPIKQTGRVDINMPKISGHRGPVLDIKWNPFNDNEIASCSEDTTIKVWQIGDHGLRENLTEWIVDLHGHQRKVNQIEWHPTAENIMISSGADFQVILWNLEKAEPIRLITCHNDSIQAMSWNRDGSMFATTCKDKRIRLIDPRTGAVVAEGDGHQGSKTSKVIVLGCGTKLFTTGFSKLSERQIALWDIKDLSKPIQMEVVDCSSGILIPYYDPDTRIVFVAGKGDGNIRYYELTDSEPFIHYLSEYKSSSPQRGLGVMAKRGLDVTKNEIFRFYKLHATGGICEPISMIVPRKSEVFQEDIYPDTLSGIPSISCDEWLTGVNRDPILISLKDGAIPFMPKIVTYKQMGYSELGTNFSRLGGHKLSAKANGKQHNGSVPATGVSPAKANHNNGKNEINGYTEVTLVDSIKKINYGTNSSTSFAGGGVVGVSGSWPPGVGNGDVKSENGMQTTSTKLVLSSRSAFSKTSSSSSHSLSPPSSPNQQINATTTTNNSSSKYSKMMAANALHLHNSSSDKESSGGAEESNLNSGNTNTASSNESVNQVPVDSQFSLLKAVSQTTTNFLNNHHRHLEELEARYITSVSRNPITLRKTESLKLESAQNIKNRIEKLNSNMLNRNMLGELECTANDLVSINEKVTSSIHHQANETIKTPPSPPTLVTSPMFAFTANRHSHSNGKPSPLPLVINTSSNCSAPHSAEGTIVSANGVSCVKKRVWTPVQSTSSLVKTAGEHASFTNFNELQKAYFKLLEEKNGLREQVGEQEKRIRLFEEEMSIRDKRILVLETRLSALLADSNQIRLAIDTTDC